MGILNCCQYELNSQQPEIISLGKAIERERLRAIKNENSNTISEFFSSDNNNNNNTTSKTNNIKHISSFNKLSYDSFGHLNIYPISIASSLFDEINLLRTNPFEFSKKLQTYIDMIQYSNSQGYYITINGSTILLPKGKEPFINAMNYLNTIQPLHALEYDSNLIMNVNNNNYKSFDNDIIDNEITLLKENNYSKYKELYIIKDKNVSNAEFVAVYNYVDLYSEMFNNRKMLLNINIKNIGISCFKIDDNGVFYYIIVLGIEKQ
jgi:hypothetical protein